MTAETMDTTPTPPRPAGGGRVHDPGKWATSLAVVPLVMFTASKGKLGDLVASRWLSLVALIATLLVSLNAKLIFGF